MNIHDTLRKLYFNVYENDKISYPFIVQCDNCPTIALVSYTQSNVQQSTITGIKEMLIYSNGKVISKKYKPFKKRDRIVVKTTEILVSKEEHVKLTGAYYTALEALVNNYHSENQSQYIDEFKKAFCDVVSEEYYELYRRACPEFMKLLGL